MKTSLISMKIIVPSLGNTEFPSLKEVMGAIPSNNQDWYYGYVLSEIVQYNLFYRNFLKQNGYRALKRRIREEWPEFKNNKGANQILDTWWKGLERRLGDYDMFYQRLDSPIEIFGHRYNGLSDIKSYVSRKSRLSYDGWCHFELSEGYVGEVYEAFPYYDPSEPDNDTGTFQNYFFRKDVVSEEDMKAVMALKPDFNYCLVNEKLPDELLPMIYYDGEDDYMLVAMKNN